MWFGRSAALISMSLIKSARRRLFGMNLQIIEGGRQPEADTIQFENLSALHANLNEPALYEEAIRRREGRIVAGGALAVDTGTHTGRSPKDKYIVRDPATEAEVWWDN